MSKLSERRKQIAQYSVGEASRELREIKGQAVTKQEQKRVLEWLPVVKRYLGKAISVL